MKQIARVCYWIAGALALVGVVLLFTPGPGVLVLFPGAIFGIVGVVFSQLGRSSRGV